MRKVSGLPVTPSCGGRVMVDAEWCVSGPPLAERVKSKCSSTTAYDPLRSLARFGANGSVVPLGDIPTNSIPDRQHHQSGILNAITESRLDGVAMIHFEGRHAPPPPTRARGADGSVGGAVQVEAVEQVVGVSVALPQRRQAVTGLDHLQDRGGVVERVIHEAAPGER